MKNNENGTNKKTEWMKAALGVLGCVWDWGWAAVA